MSATRPDLLSRSSDTLAPLRCYSLGGVVGRIVSIIVTVAAAAAAWAYGTARAAEGKMSFMKLYTLYKTPSQPR